jgi:hypothetical protein
MHLSIHAGNIANKSSFPISSPDVHVAEGFVSFRFVQNHIETWPMKYPEVPILSKTHGEIQLIPYH